MNCCEQGLIETSSARQPAHRRGGSVVGAAAAFVRPDGRCFVAFRSCRAEAYVPLLEAIALYLQRDLYTEDD